MPSAIQIDDHPPQSGTQQKRTEKQKNRGSKEEEENEKIRQETVDEK